MILYNKRGQALAQAIDKGRTEPLVGKGETKNNIVTLKARKSVKNG